MSAAASRPVSVFRWSAALALAAVACIASADNEDAWSELEALAAGREPVKTYVADFRQEKFTPLLREPIESTGRVRIAEGVSRWDTDPPYASTMLIADGELRLYYPEQQTLEVYGLGDRLDAMAASPVPDLAVLRQHFTIDASSWTKGNERYTLTMRPKSEEMTDALEEIAVDIDAALGTMRRLSLTDLDGETTVMHFDNIRLNVDLDTEELALEPPAGTKIVRPLEAIGQ
ncbi:MAG: outer membrane lipoprotein carrier protein LolA [Planctomycetota bacterium]